MINVIGFKDYYPKNAVVINTTSSSKNWGKELSPFFLGSVDLYKNYKSLNVENAWQFCKVYSQHLDENKNPNEEYFDWAQSGWKDKWAHRYPMGRSKNKLYYVV